MPTDIRDALAYLAYEFQTVVADPPWPYKGVGPVGTGGRGARFVRDHPSPSSVERYGSLPISVLKGLVVPTSVNAHLYLWTTNSFLVDAHAIARAWGFEPKTVITWVKMKADGSGASMKTGYYFRGATEHVIFGVKGRLALQTSLALPTAILSPRLPHSVKPEEFYRMVEVCSPPPRLELFARRRRPEWVSCGNEIDAEARD